MIVTIDTLKQITEDAHRSLQDDPEGHRLVEAARAMSLAFRIFQGELVVTIRKDNESHFVRSAADIYAFVRTHGLSDVFAMAADGTLIDLGEVDQDGTQTGGLLNYLVPYTGDVTHKSGKSNTGKLQKLEDTDLWTEITESEGQDAI